MLHCPIIYKPLRTLVDPLDNETPAYLDGVHYECSNIAYSKTSKKHRKSLLLICLPGNRECACSSSRVGGCIVLQWPNSPCLVRMIRTLNPCLEDIKRIDRSPCHNACNAARHQNFESRTTPFFVLHQALAQLICPEATVVNPVYTLHASTHWNPYPTESRILVTTPP